MFISKDEGELCRTVSGNTAEAAVPTNKSVGDALYRIAIGAGTAFLGGTMLEMSRRYLRGKGPRQPVEVHISQQQLREAYQQAEEESPPEKEE
jgi:hypothetical protein